ncbi:hypothetical protein A0H81_02465 [Grifola frondosa]|uniref:Uncharacterized protein n=1 Tax=Grifola frondosa TaxID=5627 RepID=A0A1C7MKE6_GRIFR|nr:hypothetical protein A0H81_02465 [Grifola frondosa]
MRVEVVLVITGPRLAPLLWMSCMLTMQDDAGLCSSPDHCVTGWKADMSSWRSSQTSLLCPVSTSRRQHILSS